MPEQKEWINPFTQPKAESSKAPEDVKPVESSEEVKEEDKVEDKKEEEIKKEEAKEEKKEEVKFSSGVTIEEKIAKSNDKKAFLEKAVAILKEYGNMESNIPIGSEYWELMNKYRSL